MMLRVANALMLNEWLERIRDRWVLVISGLFALLACGVTLYGSGLSSQSNLLIGPSLVTLAALFVPLVALTLGHDAIVGERERNTLGLLLSLPIGPGGLVFAKFTGRFMVLACALVVGLGGTVFFSMGRGWSIVPRLLLDTLMMGAGFLSVGMLLSVIAKRQITAASLAITVWFLFVFFYDLGLLGLMVVTDGAVSSEVIAYLVLVNPAGLFRVRMMTYFGGSGLMEGLGLTEIPVPLLTWVVWGLWILLPIIASGLLLFRGRAE